MIDLSIVDRTSGGTTVYALELVAALGRLGRGDLDIVTVRGPRGIRIKNPIIKVLNLLIELTWLHVLLPVKLVRLRADLVHMPANVAPLLTPCPTVVTVHDANFRRFPETYDAGYRRYASVAFWLAVRRARRVIAVSEHAARDLMSFFGADPRKISVIRHGVRVLAPAAREAPAGVDREYLLFVGAIEPHKNLPNLVKAFVRSCRAHAEIRAGFRLVLAGGAGRGQDELLAEIRHQGMEDMVHCVGHVGESDLSALYAGATGFVFPSLNEGFGLPPIEAMAHGVPIAAAASGALPEVLGDAAIFFDPSDPDDISRCIDRLCRDASLRESLVAAGRRRAGSFDWTETARRTAAVYDSVMTA